MLTGNLVMALFNHDTSRVRNHSYTRMRWWLMSRSITAMEDTEQ